MTATAPSDDQIRQAGPVDSEAWTCASCTRTCIGDMTADKVCRNCRPVSAASWKAPRVLRKALATWAERDDTRPDPKARAAADDALAAIDATMAELAALRARLVREIDADEQASEATQLDNSRAEDAIRRGMMSQQEASVAVGAAPAAVHSAAGLVDEDPANEGMTAYLECGDQMVMADPEDQGPAFCPRHGPTTFITVTAWLDRAILLPDPDQHVRYTRELAEAVQLEPTA